MSVLWNGILDWMDILVPFGVSCLLLHSCDITNTLWRPRSFSADQQYLGGSFMDPYWTGDSEIKSKSFFFSLFIWGWWWQVQNAAAIVRPPGHHAESDTACGFCFFNSVALAARYAQRLAGRPIRWVGLALRVPNSSANWSGSRLLLILESWDLSQGMEGWWLLYNARLSFT